MKRPKVVRFKRNKPTGILLFPKISKRKLKKFKEDWIKEVMNCAPIIYQISPNGNVTQI
jgi:hypothetical protein